MKILIEQAKELLKEDDLLAALANFSALIFYEIEDLNWVGFYRLINNELVLGPFQGKVACTRLKLDHGVCAEAIKTEKTVLVNDVHSFKGHIACDKASNSELVLPLYQKEKLWGVLDIDSEKRDRFDDNSTKLFEKLKTLLDQRLSTYDCHLGMS